MSIRLTPLPEQLRRGPAVSAWIGTPAPAVVETLMRQDFDTAVIDMQHGDFDETSAAAALAAAALVGKPALVRIPVDTFPSASRLLDAGAAGIIAPMIEGEADARRFASFAKYPPIGARSWGPGRATLFSGLAGSDYLGAANGLTLALAMVETRTALDALDAILGVAGIDGVFVGPSDLSIALGGTLDPRSAAVDAALTHVAARAAAHGKCAGLFCATGTEARAMIARGFRLVTISTDGWLLAAGARAELAAARGSQA